MSKLKKIFVIGRKPTKFKLVITTIVCLMISMLLGNFLNTLFNLNGLKEFLVIVILFILIEVLYIPTVAVCSEHWDISKEYLEYYSIDNYFEQFKYAIKVLKGNEEMFACKIKLDQIKKIRIYWTTELSIYSTIAHSFYFGITLKDNSVIKFRASVVTTTTDEYINAIQYLKENFNIIIEDEYGLLKVLRDKDIDIVDYINNIEKQNKRSEV